MNCLHSLFTLIKVGITAAVAYFSGMLANYLLKSNPLFPQDLHLLLVFFTIGCAGVGLLYLFFKGNWRTTLSLFTLGFAVPLTVAIQNDSPLLLLTFLNHHEISSLISALIVGIIVTFLHYHYRLFQLLNPIGPPLTGAIEITEIPRSYYEPKSAIGSHPQTNVPPRQRIRHVLRTLCTTQVPIGLCLERVNNHARLYFTTWASDSHTLNPKEATKHA